MWMLNLNYARSACISNVDIDSAHSTKRSFGAYPQRLPALCTCSSGKKGNYSSRCPPGAHSGQEPTAVTNTGEQAIAIIRVLQGKLGAARWGQEDFLEGVKTK